MAFGLLKMNSELWSREMIELARRLLGLMSLLNV